MSQTIHWNIVVSQDTDKSLRLFLAHQGRSRKGNLSRFIEKAVRTHIMELTASQAKAANADLSEDELSAIILEAVNWAHNK